MIIRDHLFFSEIEKYKQFISSMSINSDKLFMMSNYIYVRIIKLNETIVDILCINISKMNIYYTIFQSIYFFLAHFYYKQYMLTILIDRST